MGNCLVRLKAEMVSPPPNSGNWEALGPREVTLVGPQNTQRRRRSSERGSKGSEEGEKRNRFPLGRRETSSNIEGLTFDYAGRPVWRDPKLKTHDSDDSDISKVEHVEEKL